MAYVRASGFNAFLPAATGQIISWIRDPAKYKLNQYTQLVRSEQPVGVYYRFNADDSVRVVTDEEHSWADGDSRRIKLSNAEGQRFDTTEFQCKRRNYGTKIGWQALESGKRDQLNLLLANTKVVQNELMVNRTQRVIGLLENAANWPATNVGTATALGGGFWSAGSDTAPFVKKTLLSVATTIHLATNGMAADLDNEEDVGLNLVLSPAAATTISESPEIHSYLGRSPFALQQIVGGKRGQNAIWGLPEYLYGFKVVVENAVRVNTRANADGTEDTTGGRVWVKPQNTALVVSRPGGLEGQAGAPSFSTVQIYYHNKELTVETFDDAEDELTRVYAQENVTEVLAAPRAGFLVTNLFS